MVNQRHEPVNLDPVVKQLVGILDGTRDRAALLNCLTKLVEDGTLIVRENGDRLKNAEQIQDALAKALEQALAKLAGAALLVG